jgi:hypothetical protein
MWEVWADKFVDWVDNGVGINHGDQADPFRLRHFGRKYGLALPVYEDRFNQPDIQALLDDDAKTYVRECFRLGRERLIVA